MEPSEKEIASLFDMVRENNSILRGMRREQRFSKLFKIVYWIAIIVLGIVAYTQILPYIDVLKGVADGAQTTQTNLESLQDGSTLDSIVELLR